MAAELAAYAQSPLPDVAVGAAAVLLACARRVREAAMDCFARLLLMVDDTRADVACASMRAVRALLLDGTVRDLPSRPATLYDIVCFLVRKLDTAGLRADEARAHVVSLVSVFADSKFGTLHALDVLRRGAQTFKSEGPQTRMQLLELAVRLLLACRAGEAEEGAAASPLAERLRANSDKLADMHAYLFTLARYDVSFDVRDRARMLRALCPLPGDEAHVELMPHVLAIARDLLAPAAGDDIIPKASAASSCCARAVEYTVGSLSLTVGRPMSEYAPLLDWPSAPPTRVDRSDVTVDAEHVAPRAITIAGISGRAQPFSTASADYSTPRSATDHDDLDAFLNSPSDSAAARFPLPRSAVVFHQPAESSDSESDSGDETSSSGLSSSSSNASSNASGNASGSECNDQA
ncbi:AP-3 complex subunit beta, partial [Coemansia sp. RSA 2322]